MNVVDSPEKWVRYKRVELWFKLAMQTRILMSHPSYRVPARRPHT